VDKNSRQTTRFGTKKGFLTLKAVQKIKWKAVKFLVPNVFQEKAACRNAIFFLVYHKWKTLEVYFLNKGAYCQNSKNKGVGKMDFSLSVPQCPFILPP
jgi:hypothetical protein